MENSNFQGSGDCGEEIERALMDLGPLLGVTIKEEAPDELPDPGATSGSRPSNMIENAATGINGEGGNDSQKGEGGEGADSLAAPASRMPLAALRCVLCQHPLAQLDGTPKLMECLHSACEPCVRAKIEEKLAGSRDFLGAEFLTITCPACRLQCQPANMIDQRFVLEKVALDQSGTNGALSGDQQCNSCDDTELATSYCADCAEFICNNCVSAHQRLKITKDHTIKSREAALMELQAAQGQGRNAYDMFCRDHVQERLSLFCETCDRLTCRDCQLQHHRDHKYQFSTEMAAQARSSISSLLSEVSYKRVLLSSAMNVIRDRQQLIADKKKALVREITQTVVKLTNAINTRGKQLVLRLNEVCDGKQRTLNEKKDALEQLAAITDHCVDFVNAALEQGSDTAVLYSKRAVCAHLQRIKSRRADIPNPEIPVRISFALDKLTDLVRVLSTMGTIVVDGKVDAGATAAQGPYHPPTATAAAAAAAAPAPPHSAVIALQQVAMNQSYVQAAGSTGPGAAAAAAAAASQQYLAMSRARPHTPHGSHTPLRHAHVTSTTHPHHPHGMSEMNLRGLLNASGARRPPGAGPGPGGLPAQAMQHAYHQMIGAYANNAFSAAAAAVAAGSGRRSGGPRTPSPAPSAHFAHMPALHAPHHAAHHAAHHAQHAPPAKWHIPQHSLANGSAEGVASGSGVGGGADYKITLSRQHTPSRTLVTSTNPKTPSPSLSGSVDLELDKVCADSVQDLIATIAKLDSNGVQVVAEGSPAPSPAPAPPPAPSPALVHSSTDHDQRPSIGKAVLGASGGADAGAAAGAGDPNEDWCAVCMDGGELMCCDKCPKVFHQYCHIPTIEKLPDETESWQCLLCMNLAILPPDRDTEGAGLGPRSQLLVERITLELYCQYEPSLAFREPVPADNVHYHTKISRPMCLDVIRMKLQPRSATRYTHLAQYVADVRLLFRNAYRYNPPDSTIYKDAKRLEEFFEVQLLKWLPEYAYWSGEGEPPAKRGRLD